MQDVGLQDCRHYLCPHILYNLNTGIRVPPCIGLMAMQHFSMNVLSSGTGTDTFCFYYVIQISHFQRCIA